MIYLTGVIMGKFASYWLDPSLRLTKQLNETKIYKERMKLFTICGVARLCDGYSGSNRSGTIQCNLSNPITYGPQFSNLNKEMAVLERSSCM